MFDLHTCEYVSIHCSLLALRSLVPTVYSLSCTFCSVMYICLSIVCVLNVFKISVSPSPSDVLRPQTLLSLPP